MMLFARKNKNSRHFHTDPEQKNMSIKEEIETRLRKKFDITHLKVVDESHKHIGHSGYNPDGESHFRISVSSPDFKCMSRVNQHKAIHNVLKDLLESRIHALSIKSESGD